MGEDRGIVDDRVEPDRSVHAQAPPAPDGRRLGRARPGGEDARRRRAAGGPLVSDEGSGQPADRVDPDALRAEDHGAARTSLRRTGLPDDDPELPRDVRVRGRVGPGAQRAGRRPRHPGVGGGAALVRRAPGDVGRELPRPDAVGRRAGRAGLRQGAQPPGDGLEFPRGGRVPRRCVRARDGDGLAARAAPPGAGLARRPAGAAARRPGGRGGDRRPARREMRHRRGRRARALLPGLARGQRPG